MTVDNMPPFTLRTTFSTKHTGAMSRMDCVTVWYVCHSSCYKAFIDVQAVALL